MTHEDIFDYLNSGGWKTTFSSSVVAAGFKIARAKKVTRCQAEVLDTGDVEIVSSIMDASGHQDESTISIWREDGAFQLDTSCSCSVGLCCMHSAAVLEHLSRPGRLEKAFGELVEEPPAKMLAEPEIKVSMAEDVSFQLRVERRPEGDPYQWLPEVFAAAYAVYESGKHPLDPAGNISKPRNRAAEMTALNTLYALDLIPGAEEPPVSLKKLSAPPVKGTLWAPKVKEWQPSIYWQRFLHEGVVALEKRGWEVSIAHNVAQKPLKFNASSWKAEFVDEGKGWFSLSAGFEIDGEQLDLQPILATLVEYDFLETTANLPQGQEFLIFLPDGRALTLPIGRFRRILTHLGELVNYKFDGRKIKLHKLEVAELSETLAADDPALVLPTEVIQIKAPSLHKTPVPKTLQATLRDYQREGFEWMQFLAHNDLHGILADDMGLGKTMQTLTHILAEKEKGNRLPNLVIAPTSVVENWQREAAKFAPSLRVTILQGADRHRRFVDLADTDLALSSYALLHRDLELFKQQEFHLLVLDEAQHIKNPSAQVSHAVRQLDTRYRICLSGTPIENHLGELWSLFDFLMPGFLGTADTFRDTFRTPIEKDGNQARADALANKVGSLILRRTKDQVATELPPKTEIPHYIELGSEEKDVYETVRSTMDKHVRQALAIRGQEAQIVFLDALLKLRQICCHSQLLQPEIPRSSAKFDYLKELLTTLKLENRRVLIFSQFTSMLQLIEDYLISEGTTYLKLTGASKNRQELVERFQADEAEVFLISLKAGGTGLTLTNADTVIHYDPWWNPAAENQATDRAYRIGQDKPVFVHKLICKGTVEQRIQQMQKKKSGISDSILTASLSQLKLDDDTLVSLLAPIEGG
ncbi:MAG: DEAD/DEAH box helicase [Akkermansiaceae bacterium]